MFVRRIEHVDALCGDRSQDRSARAILPFRVRILGQHDFSERFQKGSIFTSRQLVPHHFLVGFRLPRRRSSAACLNPRVYRTDMAFEVVPNRLAICDSEYPCNRHRQMRRVSGSIKFSSFSRMSRLCIHSSKDGPCSEVARSSRKSSPTGMNRFL